MTESLDPSADIARTAWSELAVPDSGRVQPLLEKYLDELERWNPRFGLVKFADRRELVVKHVLDSLAGWPAVRDCRRPGRVGAGRRLWCGFPGDSACGGAAHGVIHPAGAHGAAGVVSQDVRRSARPPDACGWCRPISRTPRATSTW